MFDIVDLPKTPRIARRLIEMAAVGGIDIDPSMYQLAREDLGYRTKLAGLPYNLSEHELNTIQFIMDRYGRAVVLESMHHRANRAALAYTWLKNEFPVLIVTNTITQGKWVNIILKIFPEAKINIFGKQRFQKSDIEAVSLEAIGNLSVTSLPEEGYDFYIAKPTEVYRGELLKKNRIAQVIINHVTDIGSLTRATLNDIEHLCTETYSSLVFVNIQQCVSHARTKNTDVSLSDVDWKDHNLAIKSSHQILFPQITFMPYMTGEYDRLDSHLEENHITLDRSKWLPIVNICPHLVR